MLEKGLGGLKDKVVDTCPLKWVHVRISTSSYLTPAYGWRGGFHLSVQYKCLRISPPLIPGVTI